MSAKSKACRPLRGVPCPDCPWSRSGTPRTEAGPRLFPEYFALGGGNAWIGKSLEKAETVVALPCHADEARGCRGFDAFRANTGLDRVSTPDRGRVFASAREFRKHHEVAT